jgi:RNA polymerase sigma-70 factor (ECF subfamily)
MTAPKKILNDQIRSESKLPELLYEKYAPGFLATCIRYCGNLKDAEDVLHDGFIKILKNLTKYQERKGSSFESWMKRIIVNTALNHLRDHAKEKQFLDIGPMSERLSESSGEENYFEELAGKIRPEEVITMICELPLGYRTVFNMYVFDSYSHREIAASLGCSENTSKSQLSKARAMLRKQLNQAYLKQVEHHGKAEPSTG